MSTSKRKAIVLLSGGMDSSVLLAQTIYEDFEVIPLSIWYGQKHWCELNAARAICHHYKIPERQRLVIDVPPEILRSQGSSQTGDTIPVPEGKYDEDNMKATIVPNRNMLLLAIATAQAIIHDADELRYAAHAGDHAIYPDCRPNFVHAMSTAISRCDWDPPKLVAPFLGISKADIVARGLQLKVPFELTWTCYAGNLKSDIPCGRCGTCVERLEAFAIAGAEDPLRYQDREFWKAVCKA